MKIEQVTGFIEKDATEEQVYDILQWCAKRLAWSLCLEANPPQDLVRGLTMGTEEYVNKYFNGGQEE